VIPSTTPASSQAIEDDPLSYFAVTDVMGKNYYDIKENKLTTSSVSISRDLHCWQMSFSWIPFGAHRSWSFNIGVKAASLADLKYDKSQSMYDNMY
ncbi:hypothetical protein, partial [Alistipes communis]|uniref:hypothetical protein n=1 Tax=Alistipes communis TaxID=2585118 RepID=UPI003AF18924